MIQIYKKSQLNSDASDTGKTCKIVNEYNVFSDSNS